MAYLTDKQLCELDARDFHGEEFWKRMSVELEKCNAFRKSMKGKPDDAQRLMLSSNDDQIRNLKCVMYHSARMTRYGRCICPNCVDAKRYAHHG